MSANTSIFKTPELEKQYMAAYESVLSLWPVPHEALDVATRFGMTHINASGSRDNHAMILLPGYGANSTQWYSNIAALSDRFHVYAVDTIGQPGKSIPSRTVTAANSHEWITDVLDALELKQTYMMGISLGGWLTFNFARHSPDRVNRIVLLDPAATFEGMSAAFVWHSFIPTMIHPTRAGLTRYFRWITQGYQIDRSWGELMVLGILNIRPQSPIRATPFSDEELRHVRVPKLLLIGARSVIYNPQRVLQRATRLMPNLEAEIIPEASHALNAEKSEIVNARILRFCQA
jgi:pimeloyl-ACP methyl ester carboxylesterase